MPSDPALFWTKIGFCVFSFFEAFGAGIFPTISKSCRESPKILGIANAFAAGVFLGIAFVHILPEMTEEWNELSEAKNGVGSKVFPLPNVLVIVGYTLILIIDKVLFDTHALFEHDHGEHEDGEEAMDPAERKFR